MNVLLIEDDAMVRSWVRMALEATDFRVVAEAETSAEVEPLLERWPIDVLLVDYRLPDSTGTELVSRPPHPRKRHPGDPHDRERRARLQRGRTRRSSTGKRPQDRERR